MPFIWRCLYQLLWTLLLPFVVAWLACNGRRQRLPWRRLLESLGGGEAVAGRPLWLHAASVGEINAIVPLLRALRRDWPQLPLLVTTTSVTGAARLAALAIDGLHHRFMPLDQLWLIRRFLRRHQPRLVLLTEMELWPEWLQQLGAQTIPVWLINGRMSRRSARGYRRIRGLLRPALAQLSGALMQSRAAARRLALLGASRVQVAGNLKFDLSVDAGVAQAATSLRQQWGERPVWLAASTHEDEELRLLAVHRQLLASWPALLLVLLPRHPQRFERVAALCHDAGLALARRSHHQPVTAATAVYLADTMGEALPLMAAADLVVMGGTFIEHGGQNPLEPAALGKPVLLGPSTYNFAEAVPLLLAAGAARQLDSMVALQQALNELLADERQRQQMGQQALAVMAANRGALVRTLRALAPALAGAV